MKEIIVQVSDEILEIGDECITELSKVELIRCKDCKWYRNADGRCSVWCGFRKEEGFCDKAEKEESRGKKSRKGRKIITYFELLEMLKFREQPEKIEYDGIVYELKIPSNDSYSYMDDDNEYLSDRIVEDLFDENLVFDKVIEVIEQ